MNAVEVLSLQQEIVLPYIPGDVPGFRFDLPVKRRCDEALARLFEIKRVVEWHRLSESILQSDGMTGGRLALLVIVIRGGCKSLRWGLLRAGRDDPERGDGGGRRASQQ